LIALNSGHACLKSQATEILTKYQGTLVRDPPLIPRRRL
jgi:hypothetical protein